MSIALCRFHIFPTIKDHSSLLQAGVLVIIQNRLIVILRNTNAECTESHLERKIQTEWQKTDLWYHLLNYFYDYYYIIWSPRGVSQRAAVRRLVVCWRSVDWTGGGGRPQPRAAPVPPSPSSRGPGLYTSQPPGLWHWSVGAFNKHFAVIQVP